MTSKVVRIVDLPEDFTEAELLMYIQLRVNLNEQVKEIYIKTSTTLNLTYAYVVFETTEDARRTVYAFNGIAFGGKTWDVALIGPKETYKKYEVPQRTALERVGSNIVQERRNIQQYYERRDAGFRRILNPHIRRDRNDVDYHEAQNGVYYDDD